MQQSNTARPMTVRQMEKVLSTLSYTVGSAGLSAACFALAFCACIGVLTGVLRRGGWNVFAILLAAGILFLAINRLLTRRWKRQTAHPLFAYPAAADYFEQSAGSARRATVLSLVLIGIGLLACVCLLFFQHAALLLAAILGVGLGTFQLISLPCKRRLTEPVTVCRVEDTEKEERFDPRAERRKLLLKWALYWVLALAAYLSLSLAFGNFLLYAPIPVFAFIHCGLRLLFHPPFRRFSSLRARRMTTHFANLCSVVLTVMLFIWFIESGSEYNDAYIDSLSYDGFAHRAAVSYDTESGVYTLTAADDTFRILQLTDVHISGSLTSIRADRKAMDACYALIQETQPDLIIVTGDVVYPLPLYSFTRDNLVPFYQFSTFMNKIGVPWAMVYGNHDTESVALYNAQQLSGIFRYFREQPDCPMLYAEKQPDVYGRYNQYLRIENPDGSLNRVLFLVDSNDYAEGTDGVSGYDSVHEDQMHWYAETIDSLSEQEGRTIPSFVFMHIPFRAFADAQEALNAGSPDARYLFGKNGESVSHPDKDSGFFDLILEKGSTEAVFVGHDHLNNLAVNYKGVDLVYSRSIDYIAYPGIASMTDQRGGTLIVLSRDGGYTIESVAYSE